MDSVVTVNLRLRAAAPMDRNLPALDTGGQFHVGVGTATAGGAAEPGDRNVAP